MAHHLGWNWLRVMLGFRYNRRQYQVIRALRELGREEVVFDSHSELPADLQLKYRLLMIAAKKVGLTQNEVSRAIIEGRQAAQ